jgi:hypothetical protein
MGRISGMIDALGVTDLVPASILEKEIGSKCGAIFR